MNERTIKIGNQPSQEDSIAEPGWRMMVHVTEVIDTCDNPNPLEPGWHEVRSRVVTGIDHVQRVRFHLTARDCCGDFRFRRPGDHSSNFVRIDEFSIMETT